MAPESERFNRWSPIIMVCSIRPCTTTVWNPGIVHLAVSLTGSSRSVGSSPVLVGKSFPRTQTDLPHYESPCSVMGRTARLPLRRAVVHVRLFHCGDNSVDGGGPEHYQHSDREGGGGVIHDERHLILVIARYSFHLHSDEHVP